MRIFCKNLLEGLVPLFSSDSDEKKKLKLDEIYEVEIKVARNYQFHKKFMALCKLGCMNSQNVEMPFNAYRKYVTCKAGFFEAYHTPKGVFVVAESIAFGNMDNTRFEEVYSRVLDVIIADIDATKEEIEKELLSFY